eukprot:7359413-Prymnesium_polylepis.1
MIWVGAWASCKEVDFSVFGLTTAGSRRSKLRRGSIRSNLPAWCAARGKVTAWRSSIPLRSGQHWRRLDFPQCFRRLFSNMGYSQAAQVFAAGLFQLCMARQVGRVGNREPRAEEIRAAKEKKAGDAQAADPPAGGKRKAATCSVCGQVGSQQKQQEEVPWCTAQRARGPARKGGYDTVKIDVTQTPRPNTPNHSHSCPSSR